ncbi:hypothetical protein RIF29_37508 [Crotalaria pallida]|uniref:Uncharacterized protein n=1 Tax=Crotalaria pallida TaxID=3830 RepID=A0AAN9HSU4_CROPI
MGNCMKTCTMRHMQKKQNQEEETGRSSGMVRINNEDDKGKKKNGLRVKVVLTKEELNWLMLQLNDKGGVRLEQVLEEIEKGREKISEGWKPSLESILEAPEMLD